MRRNTGQKKKGWEWKKDKKNKNKRNNSKKTKSRKLSIPRCDRLELSRSHKASCSVVLVHTSDRKESDGKY